jgi:hypothetical protein
MKKIYNLIVALFIIGLTFAQSNLKDGNSSNIVLSPFIPRTVEGMPEIAVKNLENKLSNIVTSNGLGASYNQRFVISARVNVLTKDITPTAPPMHTYTLEVTFYIGDGLDGKLFSSTSVTVKGVGETKDKAYLSALKNIKEKIQTLRSLFLQESKKYLITIA